VYTRRIGAKRSAAIGKAPHFVCYVCLIGITRNCSQVCERLLGTWSACDIQKTLKAQHRLKYLRTILGRSWSTS
jgi:hypothetical protein